MIRFTAEAAALRAKMRARMDELEPVLVEYNELMERNEIIEYALKEIKRLGRPAGTKVNVDKWAKALPPDDIVGAPELAETFGKSRKWAQDNLARLVSEGVLEKWGRGQWRPKPDRAGEARLRVVTK